MITGLGMPDPVSRLEAEVQAWCESIAADPAARYQARADFYARYGDGKDGDREGYGRSELGFMRWEMTGRLKAPNAEPPGSAWWSAVNLHFIYLSELGARAHQQGIATDLLPLPAQNWVKYILAPAPGTWYRAHNASIIAGYLANVPLGSREERSEQSFVNIVLYRLLFAQAMVEGASFALPGLGKILANPDGFAVDVIVHLHEMYPEKYPLTKAEFLDTFDAVHDLEEFLDEVLDDVLVGTEMKQLYAQAAEWNAQPALPAMLLGRVPAYPDGVQMLHKRPNWFIRLLERIWSWWLSVSRKN